MPRTKLLAAACLTGLLAGCGGGSTTPTAPSGAGSTNSSSTDRGPLTHTGPVGSLGSPASGTLDARDPSVERHLDSRLVTYYSSKGLTGVTAICSATNATSASCRTTGTNSSGQTSSAVVTLTITPTTGQHRVTHVAP